jgi:hypothetical protein
MSGIEWFKTTSAFWSHPKIADLKDRPFRVLVSSWGYAAQHGTGGRISPTALRMIGGRLADAKALVDAGLWHVEGDGWCIHEWSDHQEAAEKFHEKRRRDAERQRAKRASASVDASADSPRTASPDSRGKRREEKRREEEPPLPPVHGRDVRPRTNGHALTAAIAQAEQMAAARTVGGRIVGEEHGGDD